MPKVCDREDCDSLILDNGYPFFKKVRDRITPKRIKDKAICRQCHEQEIRQRTKEIVGETLMKDNTHEH